MKLPDGSGLLISTQRYLTPKSAPLHERGLVPDLAVEEPDVEFGAVPPPGDKALDAAVADLGPNSRAVRGSVADEADLERLRVLLSTIGERSKLLQILDECVARDGKSDPGSVQVIIGRENTTRGAANTPPAMSYGSSCNVIKPPRASGKSCGDGRRLSKDCMRQPMGNATGNVTVTLQGESLTA